MNRSALGDSMTNRSDIKLINNNDQSSDLLSKISKNDNDSKERKNSNKKPEEGEENDNKVLISESLSEVSANDYGYFTLKVMDEREEKTFKGSKVTQGLLGIINNAIKNDNEISLRKNNFINMLNGDNMDFTTRKKYKLIKNDFELLMHLGRDENDYKNFKVTNPNEEIYKKMVF
jgi:hypothetical protein